MGTWMNEDYEKLAVSILKTAYTLRDNKIPVSAGTIGTVGELFTLSRMCSEGMTPKYLGGQNRYDIVLGKTTVLVKTKLYGDEKDYGVKRGSLWSDVRVDKPRKKKEAIARPRIYFDFLVLVGIRGEQTEFYVLTGKEFRDHSTSDGWGWKGGGRVIGLVEELDESTVSSIPPKRLEYAKHWNEEAILDQFKNSKDQWNKIKTALL